MATKITNALFRGVKEAFNAYLEWSGYWLTDYGIENILQIYIARSCFKYGMPRNGTVRLEVSFKEIGENSGAVGKGGRPTEIDEKKRADLALFDHLDRPKSIIEVKRKWLSKGCIQDIQRLAALVTY